jgi:serine/threonine-protein kinase
MLTLGSRLGPYDITGTLGAGGMGVVFRARDTRLKREVALKVLPEALSSEEDRVLRFQREAELLATLTHQNIAAIYGLEESGGIRALVMELVEGDTLAARIARGPLAMDDALTLARQLVEALDYAHEHGILHRDLKPDNIKVTGEGQLKVLDFGLAKALDTSAHGAPVSLDHSPTLTSPVFTQTGTILGTAAYMSPEQARGRSVDKRADIWAFGCVLYEMLTGRRAFDGESVVDVLAAVVTREPDLAWLPPLTPRSVTALIRRCLQKDPRRRLRDIGDALEELESTLPGSPLPVVTAPTSTSRLRGVLPWAVAAAAAVFGVSTLVVLRSSAPTSSRVVQIEAKVGVDVSLYTDQGTAAVLSPDAGLLAFTGRKAGQVRQLYVRRLDQLEATVLAGTEDANIPFFSPDGQWIAFFAAGKLKKVSVSGGPVVILCDAPSGRGGSWGDDGRIVFTPNASGNATLLRVSANGGTPERFTTLREGEAAQRWPQVLPEGRGVIYSTSPNLGNYNDGEIVVQPLPEGDQKVVIKGGFFGRYQPSGHLTYVHDGRLFAVPFDLQRLETTGAPVPVLERVSTTVQNGAVQFAASATGTAVYMPVQTGLAQPLQWLNRDGTIAPLKAVPSDWSNPRLSPDGQRLAVDIFDGQQTDVWLYDSVADTLTRLTFDPAEDWMPVWTPDGGRLVFRTTRGQFAFNLHWQRADGSGQVDALTQTRNPLTPSSWHPKGDVLAFIENNPTTNYDIMLLPLDQKGTVAPGPPTRFLSTAAQETSPAFSPDGKWIAYVSNESGRNAVYVRPYPSGGGQWLVATEGTDPVWSRAQRELLYLAPDQRVMVAPYSVAGESFRVEPPRPWAPARALTRARGLIGFGGRAFDVHPDGQRLIGAWTPESAATPMENTVVVVFHFFDELHRLVPSKP